MFLRVSALSICLTSTPSTRIAPSVGSYIPAISLDRVDFPEPIFPTSATFWLAGILKDIFLRMIRLGDACLERNVEDKDIIDMFEDMKYFDNCGGDIENLITQIEFANNLRALGKHPKLKNTFNKMDMVTGLEMYKGHKNKKNENESGHLSMYV